jgi:hypothetical protein
MLINEVLEQQLTEGGKSDAVRYNSEIGLLLAFCNRSPEKFDPNRPEKTIPPTMLANPQRTYDDIRALLAPNYNPELLNRWYEYGINTVRGIVVNKLTELGEVVDQFNWAGGANINPETSVQT